MDIKQIQFYQLKKQFLLEKSHDFNEVIINNLGLHSTDYLTPYFSLWARTINFNPALLFKALNEDHSAIRLRAFRRTVFIIHKKNLPMIVTSLKKFLDNYKKDNLKYMAKNGLTEESYEKLRREILQLLKTTSSPLTTTEIKKGIITKIDSEWIKAILLLLEFDGEITRVNQRYIDDKIIKYDLMEKCFPEIKMENCNPDEAMKDLFRKYIKQFGPVCLEDFCWWLPTNKTYAMELFNEIKDEVTEFDFNNEKYLMLNDDYDDLLNFNYSTDTPVINFLPYEDHFPKGYIKRNWFISNETSKKLLIEGRMFMGQIRPSIWINGEIQGRYELKTSNSKKKKIEVDLLYLNNEIKNSKIIYQSILERKDELESFVNEKLIPLMHK